MKKKSIVFMLLGIAALGLAACDSGSNPSTDDSTPSTSDSTSTSPVTPIDDYISANALRSIMGSFTANGTMKISYTGGYLPNTIPVYLAMDVDALETLDDNGYIQQRYNYGDVQCYYVVDVDNVVRFAPYTDEYGNYLAYNFELLSAYTASLRTSYFEKNVMGNYTVINQNARNLIASALAATYYYEDFGDIETMELVVENDVVTDVKFSTYPLSIQSNVRATVTYDLEISNHGVTVIESDVKPYDTYPEAKALGDALKALGSNVTLDLTVTVEDSSEIYNKGTAYIFDDLYYGSFSTFANGGTRTQSFGYVDYPELNGMMQFSVDENGVFESTYLYEGFSIIDAGLDYGATYVAPELFEYRNGKYVTRNYQDTNIVAPYILMDFDGSADYASEIAITLDATGNINTISYDVYFYTDSTQTDTEVHHYVYRVTPNENKETDLENLKDFRDTLTAFASLDSNMLHFWADEDRDYVVELYYGLFKINGEAVNITGITNTSITGKIDDDVYVVSLSEANIDDETVLCIDLTINDGETIKLFYFYAYFENDIWALGMSKFANPEDLGLTFYAHDTSLLDYGQFIMLFEGDVTSALIDEYVNVLLTTSSYVYNISNVASSEIFSGGSDSLSVAGFVSSIFDNQFNFKAVVMDSNFTMIAIGTYTFEGQTYLVMWILL